MSTSTAQKLKPPASFGIAFERLRDSVSKDDARSFASTTMKDVWTTAKEIETQLQRRNSLRGFRRIAPFLTGIEQYAGVIEVLCQGTPYLPFIWVNQIMRPAILANTGHRHQSSYYFRLVQI